MIFRDGFEGVIKEMLWETTNIMKIIGQANIFHEFSCKSYPENIGQEIIFHENDFLGWLPGPNNFWEITKIMDHFVLANFFGCFFFFFIEICGNHWPGQWANILLDLELFSGMP